MDRLASVLRRNLHREYPCLEFYLGLGLMQIVPAYKLMIMIGVMTVDNSKSSLFTGLCIDTKLAYLHLLSSLSSILVQSLLIIRSITFSLSFTLQYLTELPFLLLTSTRIFYTGQNIVKAVIIRAVRFYFSCRRWKKNIHTYIHTYIHTHIPTYIRAYILTYIHIHIRTYIRTYMHTQIHTYILTYIHKYVYA